jgi:hypothetical protein
MNKKIILLIIILLLTGCKISNSSKTIYEYYVTIDDVDIKVNRLFYLVDTTLGKYNNYEYNKDTEHYIYTYDDIEIETYIKNREEKINSFWFTTDKYHTNEGISIGDNIKDIFSVYGDNYRYKDNTYRYELNDSSITFFIDNDIITGIEYDLI